MKNKFCLLKANTVKKIIYNKQNNNNKKGIIKKYHKNSVFKMSR